MTDYDALPSLEDILRPMSEESAVGHDLRQDTSPQSLYFLMRDARAEARAEERASDTDPELVPGLSRSWAVVDELARQALTQHTKDLEIAVWWTESLVRRSGMSGLAFGAELLSGLIAQFWDNGLFPSPDEDGVEGRIAPIAGLGGHAGSGTLLQPLRKLILFRLDSGKPLTLWQFEQARETVGLSAEAKKKLRPASELLTFSELEYQARSIGRESLEILDEQTARAITAWQNLERALAETAKDSAPGLSHIREFLTTLQRRIKQYVPQEIAPTSEMESSVREEQESALTQNQERSGETREELLQEILRIAALFRTNEPNSPLGFTLEDAVRRSRLGWPDLLREMMPEAAGRSALLKSFGIKPPSD
jgi:type VI secretion system protein ImpA